MNSGLRSGLKIAAAVVLLLIVFHFLPELAGLVLLLLLGVLGVAGAVALGLTLFLAVTAVIGLGVLAAVVAVGVSLAPLWIPVLVVIGLIALFRSARRPRSA